MTRWLPQELIRRKRDGGELTGQEWRELALAIGNGTLADAQVGALAMAAVLRGLAPEETAALTMGIRDSGRALDWKNLPGPVLDKHSTGGIGDKVSLVLAPLVAACGGFVPMLSGRGLGHTGGTLDKLESIPGYQAKPDLERFVAVVRDVGCAIIGQTDELAPADRRLYAIRDVTATVESIPLITASILSKKLAAALDALVMDVKVGSGAFLPGMEQARALALSLIKVADEAGLACRAVLTDMGQCLGRTAGHAVELGEAVAMLRGDGVDTRLGDVVKALGVEMLLLGRLANGPDEAGWKLDRALASGAAGERFARMVSAMGGPCDLLDAPARYLVEAPLRRPVFAATGGFVQAVDARALGIVIVALGGGRTRPDGSIDHRVGLTDIASIGEAVEGRPLAIVHAANEAGFMAAAASVAQAFRVGPEKTAVGPAVLERMA